MRTFLWIASALLIAPFILLAFFAQPASDDLHPWMIIKVLKAPGYTGYMYHFWSGRISGNFLAQYSPVSLGMPELYFIVPLLGMALLFPALLYLLRPLLASFSRRDSYLTTLLVFTAIILVAPSPSNLLYWATGFYYYTLPLLLGFVAFGMYLRLLSKPNHLFLRIFTPVLVLIISTLNELIGMALLMGIWLHILFFCELRLKKLLRIVAEISLAGIAGLLIVALSPGNQARLEQFPQAFSLTFSFYSAAKSLFFATAYLLTQPAFLVILLLTALNSKRIMSALRPYGKLRELKGYAAISLTVVPFSMFFAVCFLQGIMPPLRVFNPAVIILAFSLIIIMLWISTNLVKIFGSGIPAVVNKSLLLLYIFLVFFGFSFDFQLRKPVFHSNVSRAWYELVMEAPLYHREISQRKALLEAVKEEGGRVAVLPPLRTKPETLCIVEPQSDPEFWVNSLFAAWHGLDSVIVKQE